MRTAGLPPVSCHLTDALAASPEAATAAGIPKLREVPSLARVVATRDWYCPAVPNLETDLFTLLTFEHDSTAHSPAPDGLYMLSQSKVHHWAVPHNAGSEPAAGSRRLIQSRSLQGACIAFSAVNLQVDWGKPIPMRQSQTLMYELDLDKLPDEAGVYVFGRSWGGSSRRCTSARRSEFAGGSRVRRTTFDL
jgi:hypothetical protein